MIRLGLFTLAVLSVGVWAYAAETAASMLVSGVGAVLLAYLVFIRVVVMQSRVSVQRGLERTECRAGERIRVRLAVRGRLSLPLRWIWIQETWKSEQGNRKLVFRHTVWPGLRSDREFLYELQPLKRGRYVCSEVELVQGDLFGFLQSKRKLSLTDRVTVFPNPAPGAIAMIGSSGEGLNAGSLVLDAEEGPLIGVREYRYGDPMRRIHWKTTAKRGGQLHTGRLEPEHSRTRCLLIDVEASKYEGKAPFFESVVETAAAWVLQAEAGGIEPALWRSDCGSMALRSTIWESLVDLAPSRSARLREQAEAALRQLPRDGQLVIMTPVPSPDLLDWLEFGEGKRCHLIAVYDDSSANAVAILEISRNRVSAVRILQSHAAEGA